MTITLEIPEQVDVKEGVQNQRLLKAAIALYDALLVTQGQAAAMVGLTRVDFIHALIEAGVSVIQYDSADEILAETEILAGRS